MAVYNVYNIFPKTLPCGTPALASLTLEYASEVKVEEGAHEKYSWYSTKKFIQLLTTNSQQFSINN